MLKRSQLIAQLLGFGFLIGGLFFVLWALFHPFASVRFKEGSSRGNLEMMRVALSNYRQDHKGICPPELKMLVPVYLEKIPMERIAESSEVVTQFNGKGGWYYDLSKCTVHLNIDGLDHMARPYKDL